MSRQKVITTTPSFIPLNKVESSSIDLLGYDEQSKTLRVHFKEGRMYDYYHVPKSKYRSVMKAGSIGAYINKEIKTKYKFSEVSNWK